MSTVIERAALVAHPDADQMPPALGLRPVLEAGPAVPEPSIVDDLDLARIKIEALAEADVAIFFMRFFSLMIE